MVGLGTGVGNYQNLCSRCYNEEIARLSGMTFNHIAFQPIELSDASGATHRFHFVLRHLGSMLSLAALEVNADQSQGYEFRVLGAANADPFTLMQRLIGQIRHELGTMYLVESDWGYNISGTTVRGRVGYDPKSANHMPLLIIDGREIGWEEFGHMLMTFEGWRISLEIQDPSEEV